MAAMMSRASLPDGLRRAEFTYRKSNVDRRVLRDGWRVLPSSNRRHPRASNGETHMRLVKLAALSVALTVTPLGVYAAPAPSSIPAAVASTSRSADNAKLDAGRKPTQVLQYLGL